MSGHIWCLSDLININIDCVYRSINKTKSPTNRHAARLEGPFITQEFYVMAPENQLNNVV